MRMFWRGGSARLSVGGPAITSAAGFFVVAVGTLPAALAVWWLGAPVAGLVVLSLVVGGYAIAISNAVGALVTAALGWAFLNGFIVHGYGELGWDGYGDAVWLGTLAGAALAGIVCGWVLVGVHERSPVEASARVAVPVPRPEPVPRAETATSSEGLRSATNSRADSRPHRTSL